MKLHPFSGIALFNHDKYVGKVSSELGRILQMLRIDQRGGDLSMPFKEPDQDEMTQIVFTFVDNKKEVKVNTEDLNNISIHIHLKVKSAVSEYTGNLDLDIPENRQKVAKQLEEHIKEKSTEIIQMIQELNADGLGFGRYVRNNLTYEEWVGLNWKEEFPKVKVETSVEVKIKDIGNIK